MSEFTIAIVEDHDYWRRWLVDYSGQAAQLAGVNAEVFSFATAEQAMSSSRSSQLMIVDMELVGGDVPKELESVQGYRLLRQYSEVAAIVVSGKLRGEEIWNLREKFPNVLHFFSKEDFNEAKFIDVVENHLRTTRTAEASASTVRVFLSFSSHDREEAGRVIEKLSGLGVPSPWISSAKIKPGDSVVGKLNDALSEATHLLLLASKNALRSDWVDRECNAALHLGIPIVPLLLEDCAADLPPMLRDLHQVNLFSDEVAELTRLAKSLLDAAR